MQRQSSTRLFRLVSLFCITLVAAMNAAPGLCARGLSIGANSPQLPAVATATVATGYRLPWTGGLSSVVGCVRTNCFIDGNRYHNYDAVDFFLKKDARIRAAKSGIVVFRKDETTDNDNCNNVSCFRKANVIIIKHDDGYFSWYQHLAYNSIPDNIQIGSQLNQGEFIGIEGNTGFSTATHLHFQVTTYLPPEIGTGITRYPRELPAGIPVNFDEVTWNQLNSNPWGTISPLSRNGTDGSAPLPPTPPSTQPLPAYDAATFVTDLRLPDGSVVTPGQTVTKAWRIENSGGTSWDSGYKLVFVGGNALGAPTEIEVPNTAPRSTADLNMTWTLPSTISPGTYQGTWQLRNAQGTYFGDRIYFKLQVPGTQPQPQPQPGNPNPQPGNATAIELVNVNVPANVTPGQQFPVEVTVRVTQGTLSEARGDMIRLRSGTDYSNFDHIGVSGTVGTGGTYTFRTYADHPFVAPSDINSFESVWQVWANGGWVGPQIPIRFKVYQNNRAPNKPSLTSPNDWAVSVGSALQLCAQEHGDPDGDSITGYYFDIFQSAQLWNSGWVNSNCVTPSGLGEYGFQWRVKVRDSRGMESDWSDEVRRFNILSSLAQITRFDFVYPGDSSYTTRLMVCTQGGTSPGVTSFVNTANDGSDSGVWQQITDADPCPANTGGMIWDMREFKEGPHRVRIRSNSNAGNIFQEKTFTVPRIVPSHPYQISPSFGFWSNSPTITFSWKPALRATSYRLRVGAGTNVTDKPVLNTMVNGTEFTYTFDQDYPRLSWEVIAINEQGETGENSSYWDQGNLVLRWVGLDRTAPTVQINPINPNPAYDTQLPISWVSADPGKSGVQSYDIQVFQQPAGPWQNWLTDYAWSSAIFTGKPGQTYCFRSRAHDIAGNVSQYPVQGEQCVTIDPTKRPPQAWWNQSWGYKRSLTVSNLLPSTPVPSGYTIKLHLEGADAADIYSKSLSNGNDVRVVLNDQVELERHLITFSPGVVDLVFVAQADIPGANNARNYQLYYSNPGANVPSVNLANIYAPAVDANTVAAYQFEEASGASTDLSGHGNTATWSGTPTRSQSYGQIGQGVHLSGSEWARVNGNVTTSDQLTAEAWVWLDTLPQEWHGIVSKANDRDVRWRLTIVNGHFQSQLWLITSNGEAAERNLWYNATLQTGRWYHLAMTYDGATFRLWVDGTIVDSTQVTGRVLNTYSSTDTVFIGRNNLVDAPLIGRIDGVRISDIARTAFPYAQVAVAPSVAVGNVQVRETAGNPEDKGQSDLMIQSVRTQQRDDGSLQVETTIINQGPAAGINEPVINLAKNYTPSGPGDVQNSINLWVNKPLSPGSMATLVTIIPSLAMTNTGLLTGQATLASTNYFTSPLPPASEVTATLAVQVDALGVTLDTDRSNNLVTDINVCQANNDGYEGDNSAAQAQVIANGQSQHHNFTAQSDQDWVKFQATTGVTYTIRTTNLGVSADTMLDLYTSNQSTLVLSNDDSQDGLASQIVWKAPTTDTYYVRVRNWNPNTVGCGTGYDLQIQASNSTNPIPANPAAHPVWLPLIKR